VSKSSEKQIAEEFVCFFHGMIAGMIWSVIWALLVLTVYLLRLVGEERDG